MSILLTGGLGFIGSHTAVELLQENYQVVIIDNLSNSKISVLTEIEKITNKKPIFYQFDLQEEKLNQVFSENKIQTVIHFAGFKAVAESISNPLLYYQNNLVSTLNLLKCMEKHRVNKLIFSSSATVYGNAPSPVSETSQVGLGISNPYGKTKFMIEEILKDFSKSNKDFCVVSCRYFNPVNSHPLLKENPNSTPNNLFPHLVNCYNGKEMTIFGQDYKTIDGTCVRDFIHVVDLAKGHLAALKVDKKGFHVYNFGTGKGMSVLELVKGIEKVNGVKLKYKFGERREGDLDCSYANVEKAKKELGWKAELGIDEICLMN